MEEREIIREKKLEEKRGRISYEEFLEWCDEDTLAEWVDGEIVFYTPASYRHQRIFGFLFRILADFVEHRNLGEIFSQPFQMKLPILRGREPDLLYVSKENLNKLKENYLNGPADLVVEIVSPESRLRDKRTKFYEYERSGIKEYWIIDYEERQAEFYFLKEEGKYEEVSLEPEGIYRSKIIPGFWIKIDWLWQDPLPSPISILKELGILA